MSGAHIPPPVDPAIKAEVMALFIAKVDVDEIARRTGQNPGTIRVWATRGGWVAKKNAQSLRIADKIGSQVARTLNAAAQEHTNQVTTAVKGLIDRIPQIVTEKPSQLVDLANALSTLDETGRRNAGLTQESGAPSHFHLHTMPAGGFVMPPRVGSQVQEPGEESPGESIEVTAELVTSPAEEPGEPHGDPDAV